jgi:hypothetical protein
MAIVSLAMCAVLLVYWWRSNHGHSDELMLGSTGSTQAHFISEYGRVEIVTREAKLDAIQNQVHFYQFKEFIGWFLIVPALWAAIKIRSLLPRPGAGKNEQ